MKKGFTLAEILGVIVIVGILVILVVPTILNGVNKKSEEVLEAQKKLIYNAVDLYLDSDRETYIKAPGEEYAIPISDLQAKGYLDSDFKSVIDGKTYRTVQVQVKENERLEYEVIEGDGETKLITEVTFSVYPSNNTWSKNKKVTVYFPNRTNSYNYTLSYSIGTNTARQPIDNSSRRKVEVTFGKDTLYQVQGDTPAATVYAKIGSNQEQSQAVNKIDYTAPSCNITTNRQPNAAGWYNQNVTFNIEMRDTLSGFKGNTRTTRTTKTFNKSVDTSFAYVVEDKAGNTGYCTGYVKLDKEAPTLTIKAYKRTSSGGKTGSAVATKTIKNSTRNNNVVFKGKNYNGNVNGWLNNAKYPYGVYYDVTITDPNGHSVTSVWKYNASGLKKDARNLKTLSGSSNKGNATSTNFSIPEEGYRYGVFTTKDVADNEVKITVNAPIDRTAPVCTDGTHITTSSTTTRSSSNSYYWYTVSSLAFKLNPTDAMSEMNGSWPQTKTYTSSAQNKTLNQAIKDKAGNTATCTKTFNLDNKGPSLSITGVSKSPSTAAYNTKKITVSTSATDNYNGVKTIYYYYSTSSTTPSATTIKNANITSSTFDLPGQNGNTYYIFAVAVDGVGNTGSVVKYSGSYKTYKECSQTVDDGTWYDTSTCTKACGAENKSQTKKQKDKYLGTACAAKTRTVSCGHPECCSKTTYVAGDWGPWNACTQSCGAESTTRTRSISIVSAYDGSACSVARNSTNAILPTSQTTDCGHPDCCSSVYSQTTYGSWGSCSRKCKTSTQTGTKTRSARTTYYSNYNNQYCSHTDWTDSANCNTQRCCSKTKYVAGDWGSYGACSHDCNGTKTKTRTISIVSDYDNSVSCSTAKNSTNSQPASSSSTSCNTTYYHACRTGNTYIYPASNSTISTGAQGTIGNGLEFCVLQYENGKALIARKNHDNIAWWSAWPGGSAHSVWIKDTCLQRSGMCDKEAKEKCSG